jgi:hypothetical protein
MAVFWVLSVYSMKLLVFVLLTQYKLFVMVNVSKSIVVTKGETI